MVSYPDRQISRCMGRPYEIFIDGTICLKRVLSTGYQRFRKVTATFLTEVTSVEHCIRDLGYKLFRM
jgi:hypothetical protein